MRWVVYHSSEWAVLVETGWLTAEVIETPGARLARMVPRPQSRYRGSW